MDEKDTSHTDGIPTMDVVYGDAYAVPKPQPGTVFVVSLVTGLALAGQDDILVPCQEVRERVLLVEARTCLKYAA
ncbi:hypothetical protein [Streptomyces sp. NPDC002671]